MKLIFALGALLSSFLLAEVSLNVPAGSQAYDYLERLEALGCALPTLRSVGPQSAVDISTALSGDSARCKAPEWLLDERQVLMRPVPPTEIRADGFGAVSDRLQLVGIPASLWPLFPQRQNRPTVNGINLSTEFSLGTSSSTEEWGYAIALTPGVYFGRDVNSSLFGRFYLQEGYVKVGYHFSEFTMGRFARRFGHTRHGSLLYSSATAPMDQVEYALRPVVSSSLPFLGPMTFRAWFATQTEASGPAATKLIGAEWGVRPLRAWEVALAEVTQVGGEGVVDGRLGVSLALSSSLWIFNRFIKLSGQVLAERVTLSGPTPISLQGSLWFPRVGKTDVRFEYAKTSPQSYQDPVWLQGLTYRESPMGHPLGPDAQGAYLDIGLPPLFTWWRIELGGVYEARGVSFSGPRSPEVRIGGELSVGRRFGFSDVRVKAAFHTIRSPQYTPNTEADSLGIGAVYRYTFMY
jgi:hypothetical protein